ncbi:MAG: aromatic acid exporter family protein [Candidatus Sericytochromatia bacterium]
MKDSNYNSQVYVIKASFAGVISILLAKILVPQDILSAAFIATLCIKPAFYTGLIVGKEQLLASLLGAFLTGLLMMLFGQNVIVSLLSLIIVISFCLYKNWSNYIPVAVFTVLYMILLQQDTTIHTIAIRMISVFLGVLVASFINYLSSVIIRYKSFFYFRIKHASNIVFEKFLRTIEANETANALLLETLYTDYENIYSEISDFSQEVKHISKELKFTDKPGGITEIEIYNIYRVLESLKMSIRYLQDITFISRTLVPKHQLLPTEWKKKIDDDWKLELERYQIALTNLKEKKFLYKNISEQSYSDFILEITTEMQNISEDKKIVYSDFLALVIDFQQLHLTISNFDYFVSKYIEKTLKE